MPAGAVIQLPAGIFRLERYMSVLFLTSSMRHPISPKYPCNRLIINGDILSQEKSGEVGPGLCICPKKKMAKSCQCRGGLPDFSAKNIYIFNYLIMK